MTREQGRSLGEATYDKLVEMLALPDFPAGSRLPSENDLAQRLAVSRPILRQALSRLQAEGRLATKKGSGTIVLAQGMRLSIPFGPLDSISDVAAFLEFRCSLESEMAAHAARRADRVGLTAIRHASRAHDKLAASGEAAIEEDIAFHMAIARASNNRFFEAVLQNIREQVTFSIRLTRDLSARPIVDHLTEVQREHAAIADAIAAHQSDKAHEAMASHLRGGIARLFGADYELSRAR